MAKPLNSSAFQVVGPVSSGRKSDSLSGPSSSNQLAYPCPYCKEVKTKTTCKIISYGGHYIKFIPQFKTSCAGCGKYRKFAVQTQELIDQFNKKIEGIEI